MANTRSRIRKTSTASAKWLMAWALVALLVGAIAGCGSSSSSTPTTTPDDSVSATSRGTITAVGTNALKVNGVTFSTDSATVTGDDNPSAFDLQEGMVVEISGSVSDDSGTASVVRMEEVLRGPVEAVALDGSTITALGQTVLIDGNTIIDDSITTGVAGLTVGAVIEVHGSAMAGGMILATFIELEDNPLAPFKVKGVIDVVDTLALTFTIGGTTVDYSAADTTDLPGGVPAAGLFVEVKFLLTATTSPWPASVVELDDLDAADDDDAEVEGFITELLSDGFMVEGTQVQTSSATIFEGGDENELAVGIKVEAEGFFSGGILIADEVEFRDSVRLEGDVLATDGTSTLTINGLPEIIAVDFDSPLLTEINGGLILNTSRVRVRGRQSGASSVFASRVDVDTNIDPRTIVQGPVDSASASNLVILGVTVDTTSINENEFHDNDDNDANGSMGSAAFFTAVEASLAAGKVVVVKARGDFNGTIILWDQIELEQF